MLVFCLGTEELVTAFGTNINSRLEMYAVFPELCNQLYVGY